MQDYSFNYLQRILQQQHLRDLQSSRSSVRNTGCVAELVSINLNHVFFNKLKPQQLNRDSSQDFSQHQHGQRGFEVTDSCVLINLLYKYGTLAGRVEGF